VNDSMLEYTQMNTIASHCWILIGIVRGHVDHRLCGHPILMMREVPPHGLDHNKGRTIMDGFPGPFSFFEELK
jgi:hypothetical protein